MQTNFWNTWLQLPEHFHTSSRSHRPVRADLAEPGRWKMRKTERKSVTCILNSINLKSNVESRIFQNQSLNPLKPGCQTKLKGKYFRRYWPMVLETFVQSKGPFLEIQSFPSLHYQQQYYVKLNLCCFSGKLAMLTWTCICDRTMQAFDYTLPWCPKPRETTATQKNRLPHLSNWLKILRFCFVEPSSRPPSLLHLNETLGYQQYSTNLCFAPSVAPFQ